MRRPRALLVALAFVVGAGASACASDDVATTPDGGAEFDAAAAIERNATPTPTATPPPSPTPAPTPTPSPEPTPLPSPTPRWPQTQDVRDRLENLLDDGEQRSGNVSASITVAFDDAVVTASNGLDVFPSASLAKSWWVAAAVNARGVDAVSPFVEPIFVLSDNAAAGSIIDLVSIDAINDITAQWGMPDTYLASWTLDKTRVASDRDARGSTNVTTTHDAALFMHALSRGTLLSAEETETVTGWMTLSPDRRDLDPYGSVFVAGLPAALAAATPHKAGWLPPHCCEEGRAEREVLTAAGTIPCRGDETYRSDDTFSLALAAVDGDDYDAEIDWMSAAAASIAELLCPNLEHRYGHDGDGYE